MNKSYIIFDLEFTVQRDVRRRAEMIEIGAVRLEEDCGQPVMTDMFHTCVRPSDNPRLSRETIAFTGITQERIDRAPVYPEAIRAFREWLGDGIYYLCSWGPDDKHQLVWHGNIHKLANDWIRNFNDIQLAYTLMRGQSRKRRFGLKQAMDAEEVSFFGQQHNALDDAYNTAKLFVKLFPKLELSENEAAGEQPAETVYSTGPEAHLPFSGLAEMLNMKK